MIAGAIVSCIVIVLLCIGCFVAMFVFVQPLLKNVSKPIMKTLALLNEICDVEFTEERKKDLPNSLLLLMLNEKIFS